MNTPMMDNLRAAFRKTPPSPLYGKPLVYLPGASAGPFRTIPGSVIEPPYGENAIGHADKIAYVLVQAPEVSTWTDHLIAQLLRSAAYGYGFVELDNANAHSIGTIQKMITMAHGYGLSVIAKNPKALQILSHANVGGVIVERGAGTPAEYDALRNQARKDGILPIWFVFDGPAGASACASQITEQGYRGMGVSYSTSGRYGDSHTVSLPSED